MKIEYGPREKLEKYGIQSLDDKELLAILIKTGSKDEPVLELSEKILKEVTSLSNLNDYTFEELMMFKGIGKAKAMTIISAIELSNRIRKQYKNTKTIRTLRDEVIYLKDDFYGLSNERIVILYLNPAFKIISKQIINSFSFNSSYFTINEILKRALKLNSTNIIIAHNHPSGSTEPSVDDKKTLNNLENKLNEFNINLFDSLILTDEYYYSMKYSIMPHKIIESWFLC